MAPTKCRDWILDTIDQLRVRKARPDLHRICHMVKRRHGLTVAEISAGLEKLVDAGIVIKVDYKGSTSYRNAAKWKKSSLGGQVLNSNWMMENLKEAVSVTCQGEEKGSSLKEIEKWFATNCPNSEKEWSRSSLEEALDREVECGRLKKLLNGRYGLVDKQQKAQKAKTSPAKAVQNSVTPPNQSSTPGSGKKRGRPPSKRKKFKKSHDDDFVTTMPVKRERKPVEGTSEQGTNEEPCCDFCQKTASSNRKGFPEDLLTCIDCNATAHPSCMKYSEALAKKARNSPWQCINCKICYICQDSGDDHTMLFCDACDKGYHMECHTPPLTGKPKGKWVCRECRTEGVQMVIEESEETSSASGQIDTLEDGGASFPPTPCDSDSEERDTPSQCSSSPVHMEVEETVTSTVKKSLSKEAVLNGQNYPDAADWTIKDVVNFFEGIGFVKQAEAFEDQEIDGKSLLLMKRSDVLTGLSLKLGPALKIYRHVQGLQTAGQVL